MNRYRASRLEVFESEIRYAVNSVLEALPDVLTGFALFGAIMVFVPILTAIF